MLHQASLIFRLQIIDAKAKTAQSMTQRHTCAAASTGFKGANPFKLFCERKEIWTIDSVVFAKKTMTFSLRFGQLILRIRVVLVL